jgi:hypothetical protein
MVVKVLDIMPPHYYYAGEFASVEKFAELIVRECAEIANDHNSEVEGVTLGVGKAIKQHYGVEE